MRTLRFNVDGLIVSKAEDCDFDGLVPGTSGYLRASFIFSPEWHGTVKAVEFIRGNVECPAQILKDGKSCIIPEEALIGNRFQIRVYGKKE